jgi:cytochrome b561
VHFLFYVIILGMIASGIATMALSVAAPLIFGGRYTRRDANRSRMVKIWKLQDGQ